MHVLATEVLRPGRRCPLDYERPVHQVVDVRGQEPELAAREFGAVCAPCRSPWWAWTPGCRRPRRRPPTDRRIHLTTEGHDRTGGATMHANPGDWLVVETSTLDRHGVRGRIEEVLSTTGEPPYRVRWAQDDHVSIVSPGPDARVLTSAELTDLDAGRSRQFTGRSGDTVR